jgi:hypothetical protein
MPNDHPSGAEIRIVLSPFGLGAVKDENYLYYTAGLLRVPSGGFQSRSAPLGIYHLVTPANEQNRAQVAFVDQGYTGDETAAAAEEHGIRPEVVKLPTAKRGFGLLPRR